MKKTALILLMCLLVPGCHRNTSAHQEITKRYLKGRLHVISTYSTAHGKRELVKQIYFHTNGKVYGECHFQKGKKHGLWLAWNSNGSIKSKTLYHQDQTVKVTTYGEKISSEQFYDRGSLHLFREYKNGILFCQSDYRGGKVYKKVFYYPDGRKSDEREYWQDQLHGWSIYWDRNGHQISATLFKEGKRVLQK